MMTSECDLLTSPLTVRALLGPVSPVDAAKIQHEWKKSAAASKLLRLTDPYKGLERQGRWGVITMTCIFSFFDVFFLSLEVLTVSITLKSRFLSRSRWRLSILTLQKPCLDSRKKSRQVLKTDLDRPRRLDLDCSRLSRPPGLIFLYLEWQIIGVSSFLVRGRSKNTC